MTQFKLAPDFKPSYIGHEYTTIESGQKQETDRLNIIGSRISDYLSLIESVNMELYDFQSL